MSSDDEWIQTPSGRIKRPASEDVPTATTTLLIGDGQRLMVCVARPVLSPDNMDKRGEDRELELVAAFGLTTEGVEGHINALLSASARANPGRNAPCPCGSGKKYKHCHGAS